jgi:hypothetical protein
VPSFLDLPTIVLMNIRGSNVQCPLESGSSQHFKAQQAYRRLDLPVTHKFPLPLPDKA